MPECHFLRTGDWNHFDKDGQRLSSAAAVITHSMLKGQDRMKILLKWQKVFFLFYLRKMENT